MTSAGEVGPSSTHVLPRTTKEKIKKSRSARQWSGKLLCERRRSCVVGWPRGCGKGHIGHSPTGIRRHPTHRLHYASPQPQRLVLLGHWPSSGGDGDGRLLVRRRLGLRLRLKRFRSGSCDSSVRHEELSLFGKNLRQRPAILPRPCTAMGTVPSRNTAPRRIDASRRPTAIFRCCSIFQFHSLFLFNHCHTRRLGNHQKGLRQPGLRLGGHAFDPWSNSARGGHGFFFFAVSAYCLIQARQSWRSVAS